MIVNHVCFISAQNIKALFLTSKYLSMLSGALRYIVLQL
jgi:hypothetical protein